MGCGGIAWVPVLFVLHGSALSGKTWPRKLVIKKPNYSYSDDLASRSSPCFDTGILISAEPPGCGIAPTEEHGCQLHYCAVTPSQNAIRRSSVALLFS